jgi:DNA polymerase-3 subunit epsilon
VKELLRDAAQAPRSEDPPRGGVWDHPLTSRDLAFFDLEMTGLDPDKDAIVELAVVFEGDDGAPRSLSRMIATSVESGEDALAMHGLTPAVLHAEGVSEATALAEFAEAIAGRVLVGHGTELDLVFLSRALVRHLGERAPPVEHAIDTLTLTRRALRAPSYALGDLCARLGLPARRWHRAEEDALAARSLFHAVRPMFAPTSARDLWEVRVAQRRERVRVREAISTQIASLVASGLPAGFVVRHGGGDPRTIRGVVERWDPPHARVRRANAPPMILRADRILRLE